MDSIQLAARATAQSVRGVAYSRHRMSSLGAVTVCIHCSPGGNTSAIQDIGAIATAVGVIVALFGPSLWRRVRRPKLSIDYEYSEHPGEIRLGISNERRRETAHDAEVYVIEHKPPENSIPPAPGPQSRVDYAILRR